MRHVCGHAFATFPVDNTDLALEQAEERLLGSLASTHVIGQALTLADTILGRGLDAAELSRLGRKLSTRHRPGGQVLFRLGDPGDGFFLSLAGDVGLRMPNSERRLASFAPGVVIGEMATLTRGMRSAEAFAESDVTALKLSVDDFDRLMIERPALAAKLLKSMSLHLAIVCARSRATCRTGCPDRPPDRATFLSLRTGSRTRSRKRLIEQGRASPRTTQGIRRFLWLLRPNSASRTRAGISGAWPRANPEISCVEGRQPRA
jgi:CRP-like cAMP-binding protein